MTRRLLAIAGFVSCTLHGCATTDSTTHTAPVVEFSQKNGGAAEAPGSRAAPATATERATREQPPAASVDVPITLAPPTPRTNAPIATHPAALALLNEAMRQEKSGELEVAAAKLERALRIEPRNPLLWHQLASIRLRQGQTQLAVNLAQKSNSYTAQNSELAVRNQRIIDRAQRQ